MSELKEWGWKCCIVAWVCLLSVSCASQKQPSQREASVQGDYALTDAEQRMREQSKNFDKTVWQGALIGGGLGALSGAIWGLVKGDDTKDVAIKSAIGLGVGAATGALAGKYIAHKQKQYADREDQLDSMIGDVRQKNQEIEALNASVEQVVAEDKSKLAALDEKYKQGLVTEQEVKQERQKIAENKTVITKAVEGANDQLAMFDVANKAYQEENPGVDTQEFSQELETYRQHIETLDSLAKDLDVA